MIEAPMYITEASCSPDDRHQPGRGSLLVHRHVEGAVFVHPLSRVRFALHLLVEVAQSVEQRFEMPGTAWRIASGSRPADLVDLVKLVTAQLRDDGAAVGSNWISPSEASRAAPRAPGWCSPRVWWPAPPGPAGCPRDVPVENGPTQDLAHVFMGGLRRSDRQDRAVSPPQNRSPLSSPR